MRRLNELVLSAPDTASIYGSVIDSNQLVEASFQAYFGDSTVDGTVYIEASNDIYSGPAGLPFTPTNWAPIPSATVTITGGAPGLITLDYVTYRWLRVAFVYTSGGSSTITVNMFALSE